MPHTQPWALLLHPPVRTPGAGAVRGIKTRQCTLATCKTKDGVFDPPRALSRLVNSCKGGISSYFDTLNGNLLVPPAEMRAVFSCEAHPFLVYICILLPRALLFTCLETDDSRWGHVHSVLFGMCKEPRLRLTMPSYPPPLRRAGELSSVRRGIFLGSVLFVSFGTVVDSRIDGSVLNKGGRKRDRIARSGD